jgi:hypothetical protein
LPLRRNEARELFDQVLDSDTLAELTGIHILVLVDAVSYPGGVSRLQSGQASIENAATPIPASLVAPVPTRPTALYHQIDKVRYANLE